MKPWSRLIENVSRARARRSDAYNNNALKAINDRVHRRRQIRRARIIKGGGGCTRDNAKSAAVFCRGEMGPVSAPIMTRKERN